MTVTADLRYPIGRLMPTASLTEEARAAAIEDIAALPTRMRQAVAGLSEAQIETPYRPGGWTIRQLVHHVGDSHMHGYIRAKLALTEESPIIKPYDENTWATLADVQLPVDVSLKLLDALHARWTAIYRSLAPEQFSSRSFYHPELRETQTIDQHLHMYSWHSRHHVAHITALRQREGW